MEPSEYYDGLSPHPDTYLIVLAESLRYCESENVKRIRRYRLMKRSYAMLDHLTGIKHSSGGAFSRAIERLSKQGLIRVDDKCSKRTWIYPNFKSGKRELEKAKKRNVSEDLSFLRIAHKRDQLSRRTTPLVESVSVSDTARLTVTKAQP
jgi:hypothetical protein